MDIKSDQEMGAIVHAQRLAREAALLKRAKTGSTWSLGWQTGFSVLLAGLLAGDKAGLLVGNNSLKAGAIGGIFALMFFVSSPAHARVNALVELLELRGNMGSTPEDVTGRSR